MNDKYTISIESAILGGSCSLAKNGTIVDGSIGLGGVSRAEDLLLDIASLIRRNEIVPTDISNIIVSAGPGSFTGIRIGIATALGFAAAIDIVPQQISLFEAMAVVSDLDPAITVAVPGGRGMAHIAEIETSDTSLSYNESPKAVPIDELAESENLVVFANHFDQDVLSKVRGFVKYLDGSPAAVLIAASLDARVRKDVEPILISKGQFT